MRRFLFTIDLIWHTKRLTTIANNRLEQLEQNIPKKTLNYRLFHSVTSYFQFVTS